jgi:RHS repeat-associated protein
MVDYHGNTTSYTYNDLGQLSTLTAPGSKIWTCEYDGYSRLTKVDMPNGMHTEYGFDTDGRATKTHHKDGSTVKQGFDYAFDDGGNITKITHENSAYWAYEYDGRERLTKAERYDGTPSLLHRYTYTYDDGDNILTKAIYDAGMATTDTTTFTYNNANEQTSMVNGATTTNMAYDAWGQLTSRTRGTYLASYVYRYGGKLYSVTSDYPGEDDVTYETGGDQKRRSRVSGLDETWYNWSMKWVVVSEEDNADGSSGSLARTYVGRNTAHVDGTAPSTGTWKYYTTERLNSTSGVWNQDKTTFAEFDYTPFGDLYTSTGSVGNVSHRFTGHDWDDANELYFAPYRYYSATLLRWVKKDPAGMIDGPNMFTYAKNRPILYSDRLGLKIPFLPGKIKVGKNCKRKYLDDFSHKPEDGGDLEDLPDPGDTTPTDGFYGPTGRFKIPDGTTCTVKCNKKGKPVSVKCCNKVPGFVPTKIPDDDPYFPDNPHGPNDIPPLTGPILPPTGPGPPYIPPFKL